MSGLHNNEMKLTKPRWSTDGAMRVTLQDVSAGHSLLRIRMVIPVVAGLAVSACTGPLGDLADRHATTQPAPSSLQVGERVVLLSPRHRGAFTFSGGVAQAFAESGVFLEVGPSWFERRLWIPAASISGCSRTQWSKKRWETNLWVEDAQVLIRFPDSDGRVLQWCTEHSITVFDRATQSKWLHEGVTRR
jgi:hypothetical protein